MPAGAHRFSIGSIHCTVLSDGYFSYPVQWLFPAVEPEELTRSLASRRLPRETVLSPYTCLLIETGREVVLVDAGAGESSRTSGALRARLDLEGIRPKDVDTVVITHAHPDHAGGLIGDRRRPAFPCARHVLMESEWDFWMGVRPDLDTVKAPDEFKNRMLATARAALTTIRHQVEPISSETEIVPGVRLIPAPGHTPGHLAVMIASEGESLFNIADAAVHPLHLECLEWESGLDACSEMAVATRKELADRAAREGTRMMAFHFPFPSVGRLAARAGGGWMWEPGL